MNVYYLIVLIISIIHYRRCYSKYMQYSKLQITYMYNNARAVIKRTCTMIVILTLKGHRLSGSDHDVES